MYYWDQFLDYVELFTNETFWVGLFGERAFAILKRYAGNDTILFCLFMPVMPMLLGLGKTAVESVKKLFEDFFYVSIIIDENELIYTPVDEYITKNFKGVEALRRVRGKTGYENPEDEAPKRYYYYYKRQNEHANTPIVDVVPEKYHRFELVYKGYKIFVTRSEENPFSDSMRRMDSRPTNIIVIRMRSQSLGKLRSFLQDWVNEYYDARKNKLIIYKSNSESRIWDDDNYWKEHGFKSIRPFSSVVLKKNLKEKILHDILKFKESKEWYYDRGIPYRRGYLLYGPPGTGKTSFIRSLASHIKMNVAVLNLASVGSDDALSSTIANIPKNSIVVLEDIDHYKFEEGVSDKSKDDPRKENKTSTVSVSGILNALDGIASLEELIIFMTCNDENAIPPALLRPGRIDVKLYLGYVDDYQTELIFWRFFCSEEKETELENIPREKYPFMSEIIKQILVKMREECRRVSGLHQGIDSIQISPAELVGHFLYYALEHSLSRYSENLHDCCRSILENIPSFVETVAKDRIQAIEHEKKKKKLAESQDEEKKKKEEEKIPTPPLSPTSEKRTVTTSGDSENKKENDTE